MTSRCGCWGKIRSKAPVARAISWAHQQPDEGLRVVHVRDWRDSNDGQQRQHLEQFGAHFLAGTDGAQLVFAVENVHPQKAISTVNATTLGNFIDAGLGEALAIAG
jgi:nicotinamidase-related amidase